MIENHNGSEQPKNKYVEEYNTLTPEEKNNELIKLFSFMTKDTPLGKEEVATSSDDVFLLSPEQKEGFEFHRAMDEISGKERSIEESLAEYMRFHKRYNSQTLSIMKDRLSALLEFAPITSSYKQRILFTYEVSYMSGFGGNDVEAISSTSHLIGIAAKGETGIFHPDTARPMEQKTYLLDLQIRLSDKEEEDLDGSLETMRVWYAEYVSLYQTEP